MFIYGPVGISNKVEMGLVLLEDDEYSAKYISGRTNDFLEVEQHHGIGG